MPKHEVEALDAAVAACEPSAAMGPGACADLLCTIVQSLPPDVAAVLELNHEDPFPWHVARAARDLLRSALAWAQNRDSAWHLLRARAAYNIAGRP